MIKDNQRLLNGIHILTDGLILVLAMPLAYWVRFSLMNPSAPDSYGISFYLIAAALSMVGFLILFSAFNLYKSFRMRSLGLELWIVLKASAIGMIALVTGLFVLKYIDFSRWLLIVYFLLFLAGLTIKRGFMRYILHKWRESGRNLKHVVLVGGGTIARRYLDSIRRNRYLGFSAVGFVSNSPACTDLMHLGDYSDLAEVLELHNPDEVVIAIEPEEYARLDHVIGTCECSGIKSSIIPFCHTYLSNSPQIDMVEGVPLINIRRVPLEYIGNALMKRFTDIFVSSLMLILLSPLMLITSFGVKLSSPGPVFFRQERMGRNRKLFSMLKFRSMRVNGAETTGWSTQFDPRRTRFGAFIRKFSIDELPQLVNVLRGDMSLVGPRPELPHFVGKFRTDIPLYMVKHQVRPGITGWAQVNGLRGDFEYRGYEVTFVQNFTDVDDRIIKRAQEEGVSSDAVAQKYIAEYMIDAKGLGVCDATVHPKATENIKGIIDIIRTLIEKGYAYVSGGTATSSDVYYRTEKFDGYGKLSHQDTEELVAGVRIDVSDIKESPLDFALWKAAKPGEPSWDSPWGKGRPGWHIECSVMSGRYLGETIDIHCGGQDLMFPHHENEIAQSEAASGVPFVRYWLHNGFLNIDNKKMSKSLGNFFTVREAAEAYGYENIRMFMLMSHYRSPLNYSGDILLQAQSALERLKTARSNLVFLSDNGDGSELKEHEKGILANLPVYRERFIEAMDDDFNTADAIAVIFELARESNSATTPERRPSKSLAGALLSIFDELTGVLGLIYGDEGEKTLEEEVEALIAARQAARKEKNWAEADRIRDRIKEMGIILEDTPQGVKWRKA